MNIQEKRILIKAPNWVGDCVMSVSFIRAVSRRFSSARVYVLVKEPLADIFRHESSIECIITYDCRGGFRDVSKKIALWKRIRSLRIDLAFILPKSFESALWMVLGGISKRVGFKTQGRGWLLTDRIIIPSSSKRRHQLFLNMSLLGSADVDVEAVLGAPLMTICPEEIQDAFLLMGSVTDGCKRVVVNPGATYGSAKMWPAEYYARLIKLFSSRADIQVVVVGKDARGPVLADGEESESVVDLRGKTTLRMLGSVIKQCDLLISNDTGPMHVGVGVRTDVLALFGPTNYAMTAPLGRHWVLKRDVACSPCMRRECTGSHECMRTISVEEVYELACKILDGRETEKEETGSGILYTSS